MKVRIGKYTNFVVVEESGVKIYCNVGFKIGSFKLKMLETGNRYSQAKRFPQLTEKQICEGILENQMVQKFGEFNWWDKPIVGFFLVRLIVNSNFGMGISIQFAG